MAFINVNVNPDFAKLVNVLERIAVAIESFYVQAPDTSIEEVTIDDYEAEQEKDESADLDDPDEPNVP